jgi:hypothetical protein
MKLLLLRGPSKCGLGLEVITCRKGSFPAWFFMRPVVKSVVRVGNIRRVLKFLRDAEERDGERPRNSDRVC